MTGAASVVTPLRFSQGLTYADFLAQAKVNVDLFQSNLESARVLADDADFFRRQSEHMGGATKILAIGEDWCPDVYRGLPVIAKIAEASGIELKVFPRDKNLDIANEFLNQGQFLSIPVAVFYTANLHYIAHWIERPALANIDRAELTAQLKSEMPAASDVDFRAEMRKRTLPRYPAWQQATVREIRALLAKTTGAA